MNEMNKCDTAGECDQTLEGFGANVYLYHSEVGHASGPRGCKLHIRASEASCNAVVQVRWLGSLQTSSL